MNASLLLFCLALAPVGDISPLSHGKERLYDLAALSPADAFHLDGRRGLFRISLDSLPGEYDGFILYDCRSPDAVFRAVRLYPGQEVDDEMVVEATLHLVRHPAWGPFPALVEYRLTQAVRRR
jgi:hypothetical protein